LLDLENQEVIMAVENQKFISQMWEMREGVPKFLQVYPYPSSYIKYTKNFKL
jgi:hypothetical protein